MLTSRNGNGQETTVFLSLRVKSAEKSPKCDSGCFFPLFLVLVLLFWSDLALAAAVEQDLVCVRSANCSLLILRHPFLLTFVSSGASVAQCRAPPRLAKGRGGGGCLHSRSRAPLLVGACFLVWSVVDHS